MYYLQHCFQVDVIFFISPKEKGNLAQRNQMICPSAHNSHCQSQMSSDLSMACLDHDTHICPPWMKCLTSGFSHYSSYC